MGMTVTHAHVSTGCMHFTLQARLRFPDPCSLRAAGGTADNIKHTTLSTAFILGRQKPHEVERTQLMMNEMTD